MSPGAILRLLAALLALAAFGAAAGAPALEAAGKKNAAALLRAALSPSCHQKPERSLSVAGGKMALCARCAGIYAAIPIALLALGLLWPRPRVNRGLTASAIFLVPMAADGTLQAIGLYDAPLVRVLTGAAAGAGIALVWHVLFTAPPAAPETSARDEA